MVGWMGGCCCGPTEPPIWTCNSPTFFEDDFSPTWDPSWTWQQDIATANGKLIVFNETAQSASGALYQRFNKATVAGEINCKITLDNWQRSFRDGLGAYAGITVGDVWLQATNNAAFGTLRMNFYVLSIKGVVVNQFIGSPETGDVMQLRLSEFIEVTPFPPYGRVLYVGKVEVVINGIVLYTHQNVYPFPYYEPCYSLCEIDLYQPSFVLWGAGWQQLRLDNYYINCE